MEVNLLILQPVPRQGCQKTERFCNVSYEVQNANFQPGHNHEKVRKIVDVMGPLEIRLEGKGRFTTEK